jgi:hypothetical protein
MTSLFELLSVVFVDFIKLYGSYLGSPYVLPPSGPNGLYPRPGAPNIFKSTCLDFFLVLTYLGLPYVLPPSGPNGLYPRPGLYDALVIDSDDSSVLTSFFLFGNKSRKSHH